MRNKLNLNNNADVIVVQSDDVPEAVRQTGHTNPDIINLWQSQVAAGDMVLFALHDSDSYIASVGLLLGGADEPIVRDEIGSVPMVNALGVNETYRRRGLASRLMDACETYVRQHPDLPQMTALGVEADNAAARQLYEGRGYAHRQVAGKDTYQSSWPEIDESGHRKMYVASCHLMTKDVR